MVHDYELSVAVLPAHKRDISRRSRNDGRAPRCLNVLAGMKLVPTAAKRVPASAKPTLQSAFDRPERRRIAALTKYRFVSRHVFFEAVHLGGQGCESHLVKR